MAATKINLKGISELDITNISAASVANGVVSFTVPAATPPGGSSGDIQYNNSGAFGGFADGTSHQVLHGGKTFSAVDLTADVTGVLPAANVGNLPASKITSGQIALAQGGTGVDLSASGSSTAVLAQDASHVVSARSLIAADIPNLDASKITTGVLASAQGGVANVSTAGQGYWHAIPPLGVGLTFGTNNVIAAVANRVYMCQVVLEHRQKISQVTFVTGATAGITAGNNFGWGVYDASGVTQLIAVNVAGAVATATAKVTTLTPVTLDPGTYWIAWVCTLNTTTMNSFAESGNSGLFGSAAGQVKRWGDAGASNSSTAGSLPSSLVLPTTASGQTMPIMFCEP